MHLPRFVNFIRAPPAPAGAKRARNYLITFGPRGFAGGTSPAHDRVAIKPQDGLHLFQPLPFGFRWLTERLSWRDETLQLLRRAAAPARSGDGSPHPIRAKGDFL
jgi:hypothetical protein